MALGDNLKGGRLPGSGRPKGGKNKDTLMLDALMAKGEYAHLFEEGHFTGSARFWAKVMEDENQQLALRIKCAENLAKYLNYQKPVLSQTTIIAEDESSFSISFVKAPG